MDPQEEPYITRTRTYLAQIARGSSVVNYSTNLFLQLSGDMPFKINSKFACCGAVREAIILDMESEGLKKIFNDCFYNKIEELALTEPQTSEEEQEKPFESSNQGSTNLNEFLTNTCNPNMALKQVVNYVAQKCTNLYTPSEHEEKIALEVNKMGLNNIIPLENLIENNLGQCRHQALLVGYLLTQLLHHIHPDHQVTIYRFRTCLIKRQLDSSSIHQSQRVPHAVTIYQEGTNLFLMDSTRRAKGAEQGLVINLTHLDVERRKLLQACYETFDVQHFIKEIFTRYHKPIMPSLVPC